MRTRIHHLFLLVLLVPVQLFGTSINERPLEELVAEADHVIVGKITRVSMRNWIGWEVRNPKARTGPGSKNEIRLHIAVETNGVLKTTKKDFPNELEVPLWRMWHYSLGSIKASEGTTNIFLLKGEHMERVYPRYFRRDLSEKATVFNLIRAQSNNKSRAEPSDAQNDGPATSVDNSDASGGGRHR
jgi:hypothetical protein